MGRFSQIVKNEFQGWKFWELVWLLLSCGGVFVSSLFFKDNWTAIIGALCGIFASVLTGKGKLSAYVIGGVSRVLYAIVAYKAKLYGEVMLNLLYFVPMEFYGIYSWLKNMDFEIHEVQKKAMSGKKIGVYSAVILVLTVAYGFFLRKLGGTLPFVDSFTNVVSIIAMIVTIKCYRETWILWMIVNAVSIILWIYTFMTGTGSLAILLMWIIYFVNSLIMFIKWTSQIKSNTTEASDLHL